MRFCCISGLFGLSMSFPRGKPNQVSLPEWIGHQMSEHVLFTTNGLPKSSKKFMNSGRVRSTSIPGVSGAAPQFTNLERGVVQGSSKAPQRTLKKTYQPKGILTNPRGSQLPPPCRCYLPRHRPSVSKRHLELSQLLQRFELRLTALRWTVCPFLEASLFGGDF